jgi:hypothetical protein
MIIKKRVDLGEYKVDIEYDDTTGAIEVSVLDELEGVIEAIYVTNSHEGDDSIDKPKDDSEDTPFNDYNISLN